MKILYTLNSGKPGGMEHYVRYLVKGMVEAGNEVYVWCPDGEIVPMYQEAGATVEIHTINSDFDLAYIFKLSKFLKENKIDVIHANELKAVVNSLIAAKVAGTKVRISHTHTPISEWQISSLKKFLTTKGYAFFVNNFSTKEIALTQNSRSAKVKEGIEDNKLVVIPNGIDTKAFSATKEQRNMFNKLIRNRYDIPDTTFIFGVVSRLTIEKGHDVLVKAFAKFLQKINSHGDDYRLLLAGGGALYQQLNKQAADLKISDQVTITGILAQEDLVKLYSAMNCFVFPSRAEGFGYVLAEAMYSEVPTICSDLPVLKEVGSDLVTYFTVGNDEDLSDKMVAILPEISGGSVKLAESKQRVEDLFSLEIFIKNYINLYTESL